jgi:hypothetical protein
MSNVPIPALWSIWATKLLRGLWRLLRLLCYFALRLFPFWVCLAVRFPASLRRNCRENEIDDKSENDEKHQVVKLSFS